MIHILCGACERYLGREAGPAPGNPNVNFRLCSVCYELLRDGDDGLYWRQNFGPVIHITEVADVDKMKYTGVREPAAEPSDDATKRGGPARAGDGVPGAEREVGG